MREVGRALDDDPKHYDTLEGASNRLRTILRKRAALIVLDDVWTLAHAEPFLADAPASCLLITTRKHDIAVSLRARRVNIGALSHRQSLDVLAQWTEITPAQLPAEAADIVRECGRLPLALAMIGGLIHSALLNGRADAWAAGLHRLKEAQLDRIRFPLEHYPYPELQRAIQVSVEALDSHTRDRYLTMSVFPEDVAVPERALSTLWGADEYDMQRTVDGWLAASLASRDDIGRITLHDLQLDYVRRAMGHRVAALHQQVVDQYSAICAANWSAGPNDGYFFQRIAWHMAGAANWKQLSALLLDPAFIRAKLDVLSYVELRQDFQWSPICLATIEDPNERHLFGQLEAAVQQLVGFVNRKAETLVAERWFEADESPCLFVEGQGGIGKTMLLRHLWVRRFQESILVSLSSLHGPLSSIGLLGEIAGEVSARIRSPLFPGVIGLPDADGDLVIGELTAALEHSERGMCLLVDGVDEIRWLGGITEQEFLRIFSALSGRLRFILAGRATEFSKQLAASSTRAHFLKLGGLRHEDVVMLLENALHGQSQGLDRSAVEALVERSQGNPLVASLMAEALKDGAILESMLKPMDLHYLLNRVLQRVIGAGVPNDVLRTITMLLVNKQDVIWQELQRSSSLPDSIIQALQESGIFVVEKAGDRNIIRPSHPAVLESLRAHYQLTGD